MIVGVSRGILADNTTVLSKCYSLTLSANPTITGEIRSDFGANYTDGWTVDGDKCNN